MAKTKVYAILLAITLTFSGIGMSAVAQVTSEYARKALTEKVPKEQKKQAKEFKKQGWEVSPGALPIERQIFRAQLMENDMNEDGEAKYVIGRGRGVGSVHDAAKMQAIEVARQDIATQIQSALTTKIESTIGNQQLSQEEGESVLQVVQGSKGVVEQSLGRLITVVEMSRKTQKGIEVSVTMAYNYANVERIAKNHILSELQKRGDNIHKKIEESFK